MINDQIVADPVRLIDDEGNQMGIVSLEEALRRANEKDLDLVQMAAESEPVVCRLMDYGKHLFALKKSQAAARKKQHKQQIKEVKFRLGTDNADYEVKLRRLRTFLTGGDKAKVTVHLRGREMLRRDRALQLLHRVAGDLEDYARIEQESQGDERNLGIVLLPLRRPGAKKGQPSAKSEAGEAKPQTPTKAPAEAEKHAEA